MNRVLVAALVLGLAACVAIFLLVRLSYMRAEQDLAAALDRVTAPPVPGIEPVAGGPPDEPAGPPPVPTAAGDGISVERAIRTVHRFLDRWKQACERMEREGEEVVGPQPLTAQMDAMSAFLMNPFFHGHVLREGPHPDETRAVEEFLSLDYFRERGTRPREYQIFLPHYPRYRMLRVDPPYVDVLASTREMVVKNEFMPPRHDRLTFRLVEEGGGVRILPSRTTEFSSGQKAVSPDWEAEWRVDPDAFPEGPAVD